MKIHVSETHMLNINKNVCLIRSDSLIMEVISMIKLNFEILAPMYFEEDYEELCKRADGLGMDSLTEDEQYFVDNYHRLDNFISQLSPTEVEELENATDNNEVYSKYSNAEMLWNTEKKCTTCKHLAYCPSVKDNNKDKTNCYQMSESIKKVEGIK